MLVSYWTLAARFQDFFILLSIVCYSLCIAWMTADRLAAAAQPWARLQLPQ